MTFLLIFISMWGRSWQQEERRKADVWMLICKLDDQTSFMLTCFPDCLDSSIKHDIMENFGRFRNLEGSTMLLSLHLRLLRMNQSKNTILNQRIPWILSLSSLRCEWHLSLVGLWSWKVGIFYNELIIWWIQLKWEFTNLVLSCILGKYV